MGASNVQKRVSATVIISSQSADGKFSIPQDVIDFLKLDTSKPISFVIENKTGAFAFYETLTSGNESREKDFREVVKAASQFRLTVFG